MVMKKLLICIFILSAHICCPARFLGLSYSLHTSAVFPVGENRSHIYDGAGLDLGVYKSINKYVKVGGNIGYHRWTLRLNELIRNYSTGTLSYKKFLCTAKIKKELTKKFALLGTAGTGYYWGNVQIEVNSDKIEIKDGDVGGKAGLGMRFMYFEVLASYNRIFMYGKDIHWIGFTLGADY
jgi:hypothetical protein